MYSHLNRDEPISRWQTCARQQDEGVSVYTECADRGLRGKWNWDIFTLWHFQRSWGGQKKHPDMVVGCVKMCPGCRSVSGMQTQNSKLEFTQGKPRQLQCSLNDFSHFSSQNVKAVSGSTSINASLSFSFLKTMALVHLSALYIHKLINDFQKIKRNNYLNLWLYSYYTRGLKKCILLMLVL